ncbi:MAG: hypothetical protein F6K24_11610 [Okeania sp. SIO2D1]|nr:hypothetical protein [Okeania sp. SIO2D1]
MFLTQFYSQLLTYSKYGIAEVRDEYKWGGYPACGENIKNGEWARCPQTQNY